MIEFGAPSEDFKRINPHIFQEPTKQEIPVPAPPRKEDLRREKHLQAQIFNLLRLKGIEPLWHRTDKKTTCAVGWPDFTFSVEHGLKSIPILWEIKLPGEKLSQEQMSLMVKLMGPPNAWVYNVITSVDEALIELKKLGLT